MSRLYWRIFLSFWLVIVLTLVLAFTGNSIVFRAEMDQLRMESLRGVLDALAEQAERELQQKGEAGLRDWLRRQARAPAGPLLLIVGPDDRELLDRPLPPGPARRAERWQRSEEADRPGRPRPRAPARRIEDAQGRAYLLLAAPLPPRAGGLFLRPQARQGVLLIAIVLSGLICFLLARHLVRPVRALRLAGQRIAAGDLAARVGPPAAERRDEFGALARDFDRMAERIQQLLEAQTRLLRDVSHELRSPLTRLQLAVGLLRQREGAATPADLERIEREVARLDALIGQVLALTRLNTQSGTQQASIDLGALLRELADDARFEGSASGMVVELAAAGECRIAGDRGLLHSAFDNLIRNALAHARSTVRISLAAAGERGVRITVADDGPGVPPDALERIFVPFLTLPGGAGRHQGSGLGLAIARRAVELHGGTLDAANGPDGGLVLRVTLPR